MKSKPTDGARLREAVGRALQSPHQDKRVTTGASQVIRTQLVEIEALRRQGVTWRVIAIALAEEGVVEIRDGAVHPISARRVSAFVADITSQRRAKDKRQNALLNRADVVRPKKQEVRTHEIVRATEPTAPVDGSSLAASEEQRIRQSAYEEFLKLTNGGEDA